MDTKKMLIAGALAAAAFGALYFTGSLTGCATTAEGAHGFNSLESMDDLSFARLKLFSGLGVEIAANRLVRAGQVTTDDLAKAADVLASISTTPIVGTGKELVQSLLANSGLSSLEVQSLIEIVVFELEARGVLKNLTPEGTIALTPRTSDFLAVLVSSIKAAANTTPEKVQKAALQGCS